MKFLELSHISDATSFFNNHTDPNKDPNCVIIPKEYSDENIYVGNINLALGCLENVHKAEIKIMENQNNPCILGLNWKLTSKQDFVFFYANDTNIQLTNKR